MAALIYGLLAVLLASVRATNDRMVLKQLSQTYIPFEYAEDGTPNICYDEGVTEQITFDAPTQQVVAVGKSLLTLMDVTNPASPGIAGNYELPADATDVETCDGIMAVSLENPDAATGPGSVAFFTIAVGEVKMVAEVTVGALPDMLVFTKECSTVLTANEGEAGAGTDDVFTNPEGSVSIINVSKALANHNEAVKTAGFEKFNAMADDLVARGIRWIWQGQGLPDPSLYPEQTFSKDLEPEFIALSADEKTAYVVLQENNAIAVVDIASAEVTSIEPLGFKDWAGIDSLSDLVRNTGAGLQPWAHFGMFMPDAMTSFESGGKTYIVTANEGDTKEYEIDAETEWTEEVEGPDVAELFPDEISAFFKDPTGNYEQKKMAKALDKELEKLKTSNIDGGERGADGGEVETYDFLATNGARGFSILEVQDDGSLVMVYDSGAEIEARHQTHWPQIHNMDPPDGWCPPNAKTAAAIIASDDPAATFVQLLASPRVVEDPGVYGDEMGAYGNRHLLEAEEIEIPEFITDNIADVQDKRSSSKGPETEMVKAQKIGDKTWLFVANERSSTVFMYDVSDPTKPIYHDSVYGNVIDNESTYLALFESRTIGDIDPEALSVVLPENSPTGNPLLIVAGSVSSTVSVYEMVAPEAESSEPIASFPCHAASSGGKVIGTAAALDISLGDINPSVEFPTSYPTTFSSVMPDSGTFAVPGGESAQKAMSVPNYVTTGVLNGADCYRRGPSEVCYEVPGLFSGLTGPMEWCGSGDEIRTGGLTGYEDSTTCGNESQGMMFMGITDRGPNQKCEDVSNFGIEVLEAALEVDGSKGFPTPSFQPSITFTELNRSEGTLNMKKSCPLKGVDGSAVTGLSIPSVDLSYSKDCAAPLESDGTGVDTEEVQPIGQTGFCLVVDEYYPSIMVVSCDPSRSSCGTVHTRYVPEGTELPSTTSYEFKATLPAELVYRIPNRGLESLVVSPDGTEAYAIMQSPLLDEEKVLAASTALRVMHLSIEELDAVPTVSVDAMYVYPVDAYTAWAAATSQDKVLVSAAYWLDSESVIIAERSKGQVKLYAADFSPADNLLEDAARNSNPTALTPELAYVNAPTSAEPAGAIKELVMDSVNVVGWEEAGVASKQEGLVVVNECVIALANDNDFGLEGETSSKVQFIQLDNCLSGYQDAIFDSC